jgi:hypothetical protein
MDGDYDDPGPDYTLGPSESLDSDDVRNDDGDVVVDAPNSWIAVVEHQSLAQRLAAGTVRRIPRPAAPVAAAPRPDRRGTRRRRRLLSRCTTTGRQRRRLTHCDDRVTSSGSGVEGHARKRNRLSSASTGCSSPEG